MDAERPLQESGLPLRLRHQLLVEALQLVRALLDVVRRKVSSADLDNRQINTNQYLEDDWFNDHYCYYCVITVITVSLLVITLHTHTNTYIHICLYIHTYYSSSEDGSFLSVV